MSLATCIPGLVQDGTLSKEKGKKILGLYEQLLAGHRQHMGGPAAEAAATEETLLQLTKDQRLAKQRVVLSAAVQQRMAKDVASFKGAVEDGPIAPRAAAAVIVHDDRAPYMNLEYLWLAVRSRAYAKIDQLLEKNRADVFGRVRNPEDVNKVIVAMHGDKVDDLNAREIADAATQVVEELRLRANAAGADIGKLDNHGVPHNHDGDLVDKAGFVAWRDFIVPMLDRSRMIDRVTGEPMTDDVLTTVLQDTFQAIVTDGWSRREPGGIGQGSLANRLGEHRFLHFKDGASWRAYNDRFGTGSAYDALMGHIDRMSRDIALMETLGPNPAAGLKWLQDNVMKSAAEQGKRADRDGAAKAAKKLQSLYDEAIGNSREPYNAKLALVFSNIRNWQAAAKLGSATLSTTSDAATTALTKAFNGLPQTGTLSGYLRHFNPNSAEDRMSALRLGLIGEEYGRRASTRGGIFGDELGGEMSRRVAEGVIKASGLEAITSAGQFGFGKSLVASLADNRVLGYDALNAGYRGMLDRYGIDAGAWDAIRATPLTEDRGAMWLEPLNIADRRLSDRVMGMVHSETRFAIPSPGLEQRALVNSAFKRGTILGELGLTAFQFKSFAATVTMMHAQRMMATTGWRGKAGYAAGLLILSTMAGAVALQLKAIARGKEPQPMDDWAFWGQAAAQGGGAGIYGDFIRGSQSRFGQRFTDTLVGPAWQSLDTLNSLTLDAVGDAIQHARGVPGAGPVNYGARVTKALRTEVPGGSLWYTRAAFERLIVDQLQEHIDPNYRKSWSRVEKLAAQNGQHYYWRPGHALPDAPSVP